MAGFDLELTLHHPKYHPKKNRFVCEDCYRNYQYKLNKFYPNDKDLYATEKQISNALIYARNKGMKIIYHSR